jgi:hypothetical protein
VVHSFSLHLISYVIGEFYALLFSFTFELLTTSDPRGKKEKKNLKVC